MRFHELHVCFGAILALLANVFAESSGPSESNVQIIIHDPTISRNV